MFTQYRKNQEFKKFGFAVISYCFESSLDVIRNRNVGVSKYEDTKNNTKILKKKIHYKLYPI